MKSGIKAEIIIEMGRLFYSFRVERKGDVYRRYPIDWSFGLEPVHLFINIVVMPNKNRIKK